MRILLLNDRIPPENRGGAGEVVWRLACGLHDAGHEVHVTAATEKVPFQEMRDGIATYHLQVNYPMRWHGWLSLYNPVVNQPLKKLYAEIQPDVVNAHNIHAYLSYHSLTMASQMGVPTVFSSHDVMPFAYHKMSYFIDRDYCGVRSSQDYRLPFLFNLKQMRFRYNPFRNLMIRHILTKHTQVRTTPSRELSKVHDANDLPHFEAVHNGIDVKQFTAPKEVIEQLKQRLNLQGRKVILFAGRLTGAKGTNQLLDALNQLVKTVPEAMLLVLSSVPIDEQIQDSRYANLREKHIVSGGWLSGEELAAAFQLADVMTAPSVIFDTFPTVNLEAMATHTLAFASCYGGSHEAVLDDETGYIINPYDTQDFAKKLTTALQNDDLRRTMTEKAYERVTSTFTIKHQVKKMLMMYQQAIDSK